MPDTPRFIENQLDFWYNEFYGKQLPNSFTTKLGQNTMGIYRRYFGRYQFLFFTAIGCVFCEAICDLLQPTIMARIIDEGVKSGRMGIVVQFGLSMLMITVLGACFATARSILASKVSQSFGSDLRYDVFSKIMHFSEVSADKMESGSLITRMTNDTSQIVQFVNGMMRIFFKAPVTCIGSIILAVLLSPNLSLTLFFVVTLVSLFIAVSMKMSYIRFARVQYAMDKVNTVVQEYLMGVRLVKAFGRYEDEKGKFEAANADLSEKNVSSQMVIAYFSPLISLSVNIGIAVILYAGSLLFAGGKIEVGKISAFISYMAQILASLIMITNIFNTFVRTKASTERISEVINSGEDFKGSGQAVHCSGQEEVRTEGYLVFEDVTFAYPNGSGVPAIKNLSFQLNKGETLAVIGPTGSGKSTLVWLCLRFYNTDEGAVYLEGTDIRAMDCDTVRDKISLAPQKSMLFAGTILENIAWGNPKAVPESIMGAARLAQADEFIRSMPEQYESVLGQGGVNLSGGQKQRISIARALAKKSSVMIFDDCTSALDAITEARVRAGLKTVCTDRAMIVITQRIGTAMSADRILVLDNGEMAGFGTHTELLESCRMYREIFDSQIGEGMTGN